jgi:hypothetical protein
MNNKSQFFIFAAILVIISLLAIQYSLLSYRQVSQSIGDVAYSDVPFIASYVESSFRDTSINSFEEMYRTGDLTSIHDAFSGIYSAHYAIEEKELNYYLSRLDVGIEVTKSSNTTFDYDVLFVGPSIFEVGNFNRKILIDASKISSNPKIYSMQSDIGLIKVGPMDMNFSASPSNPYVIHYNNQIIIRDSNYSADSRVIYNNRAYTIGENGIVYGGMNNIENRAPFLGYYYLDLGNDGNNYVSVMTPNGAPLTLDGATKFYEGDIFLLDGNLIKITDINYIINGQKDEYVKYTTMNVQISLQESERRRQWFDPIEVPGLRYGLIDIMAIKQNALKTTQIKTGDTVIISSLIHNDLETPILDRDINGSKGLGSTIRIWEIINVVLIGDEGTFQSEYSKYKVEINPLTEKIEGIYEMSGATEILIDIPRCRRDSLGNLVCVSAYPLEEGFEFSLKGEEYVVRDITTSSVAFLRRSTDSLDIRIDLGAGPDYGEFKLGNKIYEVYLVRDLLNNVDPTQLIIDPPLGEDIILEIGDPVILDNYLVLLEGITYLNDDGKWHVYFKYFDMVSEMNQFPVGKTRLFYGWDGGDYGVVNQWKYGYNTVNSKLTIESKTPLYSEETNSTLITTDGLLACFSSINDENFFEYDLYYPKESDLVWLGDTLTLFEDIDAFNKEVKIRIDENKNGIIDGTEGYIKVKGSDTLLENDIFYCGGTGYEIAMIIYFHTDEVPRVLIKRVPYYQYTPILERFGRTDIEEFTTILSSYKYYPKRPGEYLIVFDYTFEVEGIKKGITQYYNFKVYE